jgi:hypothetical protein
VCIILHNKKMKNPKIPKRPIKSEVDDWFNTLFSSAVAGKEAEYYSKAGTAFQNLVFYYLDFHFRNAPKLFQQFLEAVRFDGIGLTAMLKRFQRDAFGVSRFDALTDIMVKQEKLTKETKAEIFEQVKELGLRITAESPRKTRVPAAFSLWMCTFRPIYFDLSKLPGHDHARLETFCSMVNYWLTTTYLTKFGYIDLGGSSKEQDTRLNRVRHDFTCREVSFSTLETFYSAIFRLDESRFGDPEED